MTNWKNHIIIGFVLSILFIALSYKYLNWNVKIVVTSIPIIVYYSLLPDIDHRISKMTGIMLTFAFVFIVLGALATKFQSVGNLISPNLLWLGIVVFAITLYASSSYVPHRGPIHTLQCAILSPFLLLFVFGIKKEYIAIFIIAMVAFWSHLIADKIPFKISS